MGIIKYAPARGRDWHNQTSGILDDLAAIHASMHFSCGNTGHPRAAACAAVVFIDGKSGKLRQKTTLCDRVTVTSDVPQQAISPATAPLAPLLPRYEGESGAISPHETREKYGILLFVKAHTVVVRQANQQGTRP